MLSSSPLRLLPRVPVPSIFSSITCFRRQVLHSMWPIQVAFLRFIVFWVFLFSTTLYRPHISSFVTWLVQMMFPSLSRTTFKNVLDISDLLSEMYKFHHHTMLCSKCNISLKSSLNLNSIFRCKVSPSCWVPLLLWQSWFNFTCTTFIICYQATEVVEIFHILQLFSIYHDLYWGRWSWHFHYLRYFHIHFHSIVCSNLN